MSAAIGSLFTHAEFKDLRVYLLAFMNWNDLLNISATCHSARTRLALALQIYTASGDSHFDPRLSEIKGAPAFVWQKLRFTRHLRWNQRLVDFLEFLHKRFGLCGCHWQQLAIAGNLKTIVGRFSHSPREGEIAGLNQKWQNVMKMRRYI